MDPMKRISIPEIRQHPWFQHRLPKYIALRTIDAMYTKNKASLISLRISCTIVILEIFSEMIGF